MHHVNVRSEEPANLDREHAIIRQESHVNAFAWTTSNGTGSELKKEIVSITLLSWLLKKFDTLIV